MKETSSQEEAARWRGPAGPCERRFPAYLRAGSRAGLSEAGSAPGDPGEAARPSGDGPGCQSEDAPQGKGAAGPVRGDTSRDSGRTFSS